MKRKKWLSDLPERCDICKKPMRGNFVDGKTIFGPWGIMCMSCHDVAGCELGEGRGQEYDLKTLEKVGG